MKKHWTEELERLNACKEAVEWAEGFPSLQDAWEACERGDWMLWLAGKYCRSKEDRKPLVLAACGCARLALPFVEEGEERPLKAIETVEAWTRGEATIQQVRDAAVQEMERHFLIEALERSGGNVSKAAEDVGMQRTNFHALMRKYSLTSDIVS